jgi:hypothetical protein
MFIRSTKFTGVKIVIDEQNDDIDLLDVKSANKIVANFADGIGVEQYYDSSKKYVIMNEIPSSAHTKFSILIIGNPCNSVSNSFTVSTKYT